MNKIKQYRIDHKLTQKQLAEKLVVTIRTIQHWEAGKRTPHPSIYLLLDSLSQKGTDEQR